MVSSSASGGILSEVSSSLFAFLRRLEESDKAALEAYDDGYGTWTIGYGSVYNWDEQRPVEQGDTIDQPTAERWLEHEANQDLATVQKLVTVPVNNNQLIALGSFEYNTGALKHSTLLRLLNSGADINTVANEFDKWVYSNGVRSQGLINRRSEEKKLFLS